MSKPQLDQSKKLKRPRGLLASRKAGDPQPASKKARADNDSVPQDSEELKVQDWQDLEELFENALDALYGASWTGALPLVRGVLHECARLASAYSDPSLIYSPLEGETNPSFANTPASAFYTIYASAWLLMATFARNDSSLLTSDEPPNPLEYVLSALAACEKGRQALEARTQAKDWNLELTWGRALVLAAQQLAEDNSEENETPQNKTAWADAIGPDAPTALDRAFEHLSYAIKNRPTAMPEDARRTADERFARVLVEAGQSVLATTEGLQSTDDETPHDAEKLVKYLRDACDLFAKVEQLPDIPPELNAQGVLGAAQAGLAIGSTLAETIEEDEEGDGTESEESNLKNSAIDSLRKAVERFDIVRKANRAKQNIKAPLVDEEEIAPLLQEALVTLATLLPEGSEQESMYARYREEGGILDSEEYTTGYLKEWRCKSTGYVAGIQKQCYM